MNIKEAEEELRRVERVFRAGHCSEVSLTIAKNRLENARRATSPATWSTDHIATHLMGVSIPEKPTRAQVERRLTAARIELEAKSRAANRGAVGEVTLRDSRDRLSRAEAELRALDQAEDSTGALVAKLLSVDVEEDPIFAALLGPRGAR